MTDKPLIHPFRETVRKRVARDPAFALALMDEMEAEIAQLRAALLALSDGTYADEGHMQMAAKVALDGHPLPREGAIVTDDLACWFEPDRSTTA